VGEGGREMEEPGKPEPPDGRVSIKEEGEF